MPRLLVLSALALPWLNPFGWGPTPAMVQWLFCALCTGLLVVWQLVSRRPLCPDQPGQAACVAQAWLAAAGIGAVIGLAQYLGYAQAWAPWVNTASVGEAYGNLRQRNQFATLLGIGVVAGWWWAGRIGLPGRADRAPGFQAALLLLMLVLPGAANAASASRTGLLQLLLTVALCAWWTRQSGGQSGRLQRLVPWWVLLSYLAASVLLPFLLALDPLHSGIFGRFGSDEGSACQSRMRLWSNVLYLIGQKPWWGWGWGELDYAHFVTLYPGARFCDLLDHAHNLPLHLAVELGLPLAALICGLVGWLIWRSKPWRETDRTRQLAWTVLCLLGLHSLLEYPLWYGPFQTTLLVCLYILWTTTGPGTATGTTTDSAYPWPRERRLHATVVRGMVALTLSGLAVCLYAAWDYWRIGQIYVAQEERVPAWREHTLEKIQGSLLFRPQVRFAELGTTPLTPGNASHIHALALEMLHFSPEPSVVRKLIASAALLGRSDEVAFYTERFRAAFPDQALVD